MPGLVAATTPILTNVVLLRGAFGLRLGRRTVVDLLSSFVLVATRGLSGTWLLAATTRIWRSLRDCPAPCVGPDVGSSADDMLRRAPFVRRPCDFPETAGFEESLASAAAAAAGPSAPATGRLDVDVLSVRPDGDGRAGAGGFTPPPTTFTVCTLCFAATGPRSGAVVDLTLGGRGRAFPLFGTC